MITCPANQHPKSTIKKIIPQAFAHLVNFSKKMCLPCLLIEQSYYFDYRINKPFVCSRCVICVSCSVRVISTYYARKGFFILITHKSTRLENPITWYVSSRDRRLRLARSRTTPTQSYTYQNQDQRHRDHHLTTTLHLTLKMTAAQVVETSVTNKSF